MLKKIRIKNFKNFKDEIVFDFSDVHDYEFNRDLVKNKLINKCLVFGLNNSGKSNLGAAIMDITLHLTDNQGRQNMMYNYYINCDSGRKQASFVYTFVFDGDEVEYSYKKTSPLAVNVEELTVNGELMYRYNYSSKESINKIPETQNIDITKNNTNINVLKYIYRNTIFWEEGSPVRKFMEFVDNMLFFRSLQHNEFVGNTPDNENLNDYIINNHLMGDFEKFLADFGQDFSLTEMPLGDKIVLGVKYEHGVAPFSQVVSSGTLSLWLFYHWMKKSKNISFLYLDEFDAFYNYGLSEKILRYVNSKKNFQSVLTTHNVYLLDNELMRPDCYFILKNGKIANLSSLTNKTIRVAHNLEKMYLGGEFES